MEDAKNLLSSYAEEIEKILVEFSISEKSALEKMQEFKKKLSEKYAVEKDCQELFDACVYNALATINTVPGQNKKTGQLLSALTEAKDEIRAIIEFM